MSFVQLIARSAIIVLTKVLQVSSMYQSIFCHTRSDLQHDRQLCNVYCSIASTKHAFMLNLYRITQLDSLSCTTLAYY